MLMPFALLVAALITFVRRINAFPLRNWDEAWYAEISKNMASGRYGYLMPFWNGRYYFDHAPLYFWLSAPFFKLFGLGEWQARIISVFAAIFVVLFIFLIGKKLANGLTGLFSALIFLTFGVVVIRFAHGNLDSLLEFLSLGAFYFYLLSKERRVYSIFCGIFIGLGVLVKSWGIGIFPLFLILVYEFFKEKRLPKNLTMILPIAFASFGWWYLWGIFHFGSNFISWYVLNPSEGRLDSPFANFSFKYFSFVFRDIGMWFAFFIVFLVAFFEKKTRLKGNFVLAFLFVATVYISFLNLLSDKSDWYTIPAYPLIAIVLGYFVQKIHARFGKIVLVAFALVLIFQIYNVNRIENIFPDRSRVGALLGQRANLVIPKGDTVIFDDHDFTAFLYYSNKTAVYTIQDSRKPGEWWILEPGELNDFLEKNPRSWLVTKRPQDLHLVANNLQTYEVLNGYSFMKLY